MSRLCRYLRAMNKAVLVSILLFQIVHGISITRNPQYTTIFEGDSTIFYCEIEDQEPWEVIIWQGMFHYDATQHWFVIAQQNSLVPVEDISGDRKEHGTLFVNYEVLEYGARRFHQYGIGVNHATLNDQGEFRCAYYDSRIVADFRNLNNDNVIELGTLAQLTVVPLPRCAFAPAPIKLHDINDIQLITLTCDISNDSNVTLAWYRNDAIISAAKFSTNDVSYELLIKDNGAIFKCEASTSTHSGNLLQRSCTVQPLMQAFITPKRQTILTGADALFTCTSQGLASASFSWMNKGNTNLTLRELQRSSSFSKLQVTDVHSKAGSTEIICKVNLFQGDVISTSAILVIQTPNGNIVLVVVGVIVAALLIACLIVSIVCYFKKCRAKTSRTPTDEAALCKADNDDHVIKIRETSDEDVYIKGKRSSGKRSSLSSVKNVPIESVVAKADHCVVINVDEEVVKSDNVGRKKPETDVHESNNKPDNSNKSKVVDTDINMKETKVTNKDPQKENYTEGAIIDNKENQDEIESNKYDNIECKDTHQKSRKKRSSRRRDIDNPGNKEKKMLNRGTKSTDINADNASDHVVRSGQRADQKISHDQGAKPKSHSRKTKVVRSDSEIEKSHGKGDVRKQKLEATKSEDMSTTRSTDIVADNASGLVVGCGQRADHKRGHNQGAKPKSHSRKTKKDKSDNNIEHEKSRGKGDNGKSKLEATKSEDIVIKKTNSRHTDKQIPDSKQQSKQKSKLIAEKQRSEKNTISKKSSNYCDGDTKNKKVDKLKGQEDSSELKVTTSETIEDSQELQSPINTGIKKRPMDSKSKFVKVKEAKDKQVTDLETLSRISAQDNRGNKLKKRQPQTSNKEEGRVPNANDPKTDKKAHTRHESVEATSVPEEKHKRSKPPKESKASTSPSANGIHEHSSEQNPTTKGATQCDKSVNSADNQSHCQKQSLPTSVVQTSKAPSKRKSTHRNKSRKTKHPDVKDHELVEETEPKVLNDTEISIADQTRTSKIDVVENINEL